MMSSIWTQNFQDNFRFNQIFNGDLYFGLYWFVFLVYDFLDSFGSVRLDQIHMESIPKFEMHIY